MSAVPATDLLDPIDHGSSTHAPAKAGKKRLGLGRTGQYVLLFFFLIVILIPVYVLLVTSFKTDGESLQLTRAWNLPQHWSLDGWKHAWDMLSRPLLNTFLVVIPAVIISSVLGSLNGFVLSRWRFRGANLVFTLILFGMFIPYQAVIVPLTQLLNSLDLKSGIIKLILLHSVYGIPITTLIFRNYYESVPHELIEASRIDGAGMMRTYWSVVLPISIPSFVVVLIWQFTSAWNDFLFALFYNTSKDSTVVTVALNNLASSQNPSYPSNMAGAVIASIPTLVVYILLGKYFVGGLMSGSVKG